MKIYLFALSAIFCLYACDYDKYENVNPRFMQEGTCNYQMELTGVISFELDSVTSNLSIMAREYSNNFSFLTNNNKIQIFNYNTTEFGREIPLQFNGTTNYYLKNSDSIFLYDYLREAIVLTDANGNSKDVIPILHQVNYYPSPVTGVSPLIVEGNTVIVSGNISGEYTDESEENRPTIFTFDLRSKQIEYIHSYPKYYFDYNWGGGLFRWVYSTYNEEESLVVCSYPSDHNIHSFKISEKTGNTYYAGSKYIDKIVSLSKNKSISINSDSKTQHFVENHSYSNLCYDKYNNLYYRIAEFKTIYEGIPKWKKELSIIILDHDFNVIGETKIGKSHTSTYRYTLFVNSNGLHIQQESDEDQILFNIYKFNLHEI